MDSYTRIPNSVFDIARRLTPAEWSVLTQLYRRIAGWHKTSDEVSLTQLQVSTGITSRRHVIAAVRGLEAHGLIRVTRNGTHPSRYELVPPGNQQIRPLVTPGNQSLVPRQGAALVPPGNTQKKVKKETGGVDPGPVWKQMTAQLATEMNQTNFNTHIRDLRPVALNATTLTLQAIDAHEAAWLRDHWRPLFDKAVTQVLGQPRRIVITAPLGRTADGP